MEYSILKVLHIVSSTILFGTGLGTAFFMVRANLSYDINTLRSTSSSVVFADWVFTTPAVIIQPVTGFHLMHLLGYPFNSVWFYLVIGLYILIGICWIPVVFMQVKLRDIAHATTNWESLPDTYHRIYRAWFSLGFPAFISVLILYWLMVTKPFL